LLNIWYMLLLFWGGWGGWGGGGVGGGWGGFVGFFGWGGPLYPLNFVVLCGGGVGFGLVFFFLGLGFFWVSPGLSV